MTAAIIAADIKAAQAIGDNVLTTIEQVAPNDALPAAVAGQVLDLVSQLVQAALSAWGTASGTPITVASVLALLPNSTPLSAPPAGK